MSNVEEKKSALLHILSTNRALFQIPGEKFKRYLRDMTGKDPTKYIEKYQRDYFGPRKEFLKTVKLQVSPLSIGLYNATIDTESDIDVKKILDRVKQHGLASESGIKVTEFTMRYGKFQTALSYTSEYGLVGDESKPFVSADFQVKITKGNQTKGASFSYYSSGKIRFSGGHLDSLDDQPRELVEFFSKHYYPISSRLPIVLNNVTSEFKVGFPLKTSLVYDLFSDPAVPLSFKGHKVIAKYNEKKFLYMSFDDLFSVVLAGTGVIQIQGTTKVDEAYKLAKDFFVALKDNDFLEVSQNKNQNTRLKKPKPTKISKRADNLPAPNITRRGTTCPVGRRPDPYSYEGKCPRGGCYIKPNPQGQPCCYALPKSVEYSRNKVANAFKKAGVKVPNSVRKEFGIGHATNNRPVNVANKRVSLKVKTFVNNKAGFKVNTRQCLRYTKVALVDMATRLKIVLPTKITKPILCDLIKKATSANENRLMSGSNATFRLEKRLCVTYPKETLIKFARELKGDVTSDMKKAEICALIQKLSKKKTPPPSKSASPSPPKPKPASPPKPASQSPPKPKPASPRPMPTRQKGDPTKWLKEQELYRRLTGKKVLFKEDIARNIKHNPRFLSARTMIDNNFNYFMKGPKSKTS
jgi:hypothetical protein